MLQDIQGKIRIKKPPINPQQDNEGTIRTLPMNDGTRNPIFSHSTGDVLDKITDRASILSDENTLEEEQTNKEMQEEPQPLSLIDEVLFSKVLDENDGDLSYIPFSTSLNLKLKRRNALILHGLWENIQRFPCRHWSIRQGNPGNRTPQNQTSGTTVVDRERPGSQFLNWSCKWRTQCHRYLLIEWHLPCTRRHQVLPSFSDS